MNPYRTSDLYLAAYFKVAGVPLLRTESERGRVVFLFEELSPGTLKDLQSQFYLDQARVPALSYSQELKALKRLVHGGNG